MRSILVLSTIKNIVLLTLVLLLTTLQTLFASTPGKIILTSPNTAVEQHRVFFPHDKHVNEDIQCLTCHHEAETNDDITRCRSCHNDVSPDSQGDPEGFYMAWHSDTSSRSCIGCHRTISNGDVPKTCKSCHCGRGKKHGRKDSHRHSKNRYKSHW